MTAIQNNVDLSSFNTMGFSVKAKHYLPIRSAQSLAAYFKSNPNDACFILGGGSNLVLTRDIDETVLHMQTLGIAVYDETPTHVVVGVQAGESWHDWVMTSIKRGWMGLENLTLIPGSVGASPVQNIGAYGVEVKDCIHKIKAWDRLEQKWAWLDKQDCAFGYRDSIFKHQFLDAEQRQARYVISKVFFKLLKDAVLWQPKMDYGDVKTRALEISDGQTIKPEHVAQAIIDIRGSKLPDPKKLGNVGSFFKNPVVSSEFAAALNKQYSTMPMYPQSNHEVKIAAGWLIEQAGFKGFRADKVGVYEKQALVLVHYGQGTGADLMALAERISAEVKNKFGIEISPEPIVH